MSIHKAIESVEQSLLNQNYEILEAVKYGGYWKIVVGTERGVETFEIKTA